MVSRNVDVVFVGPSAVHAMTQQSRKDVGMISELSSPADISPRESVYRTVLTDFKLRDVNGVVTDLVTEICASDR